MFPVQYVSITGGIGCGKSTVISKLQEALAVQPPQQYNVVFLPEPVEQWQNDNGLDWLREFYENPSRWALPLQMKILQGQIAMHDQMPKFTSDKPLYVITERSPWDGRQIFMELLSRDGVVKTQEKDLYCWYSHHNGWDADFCFFVAPANANQCVQRVAARRRSSENTIDAEYICRIANLYVEQMQQERNVQVLQNTSDTVSDIEERLVPHVLGLLQQNAEQHIESVAQRMEQHQLQHQHTMQQMYIV